MSKGNVQQRKSTFKRDPSAGDDDANRRRSCYEKERKISGLNEDRIAQLGILHDILGNIKLSRTEKNIPKTKTVGLVQNGKNHKTRPTSAKNLNISNQSVNSIAQEVVIENKSVGFNRSSRKDDQKYRTTRSTSLYSQSRPVHNISNMSDKSKNSTELTSQDLKHLLARLSSEFNDIESITGFKTNTCSTSLTTALIRLTGHVKQCASNTKEINNLKDQLSIIIKTQLDFQDKMENQITTLQTMMQMICQLVNNEILSKKKSKQDLDTSQLHQNWLNNAQKPYLIPKDTNNAMDELLLFTRRMNNATPIDSNLFHSSIDNRYSIFNETLEASKKLIPQTSSISTNENQDLKFTQQRRNFDQELRSSVISPINTSSSQSNGNMSSTIFRNGLDGISTTVPSASMSETILEKILQERLRLVQQMAELTKQHEMTQEELANLETKTVQTSEI